jgi:hypothetical protein
MKFDQVTHYCQAETEASVFPSHGAVTLSESIEDNWKEPRSYPFSRVGHDEPSASIVSLQTDLNAAARGREFDRVGKQIPDHLPETVGITP